MVSKGMNSYCNPSYSPHNGSNIRTDRKQITKQYSNSCPIMKLYFQIYFEFIWYTTSAFTDSSLKADALQTAFQKEMMFFKVFWGGGKFKLLTPVFCNVSSLHFCLLFNSIIITLSGFV